MAVAETYAATDEETQADFDALTAEDFPAEERRQPAPDPVYPGDENRLRPVSND